VTTKPVQKRGTVPLAAPNTPEQIIALGFEHGCPGADLHLGMRFLNQPGGALDGKPFPAAAWEQSPFFTPTTYSPDLAGIAGITASSLLPAPTPGSKTAPTGVDAATWKGLVTQSKNVKAKWFLVHDTGGGYTPKTAPEGGASGIHLFIGPTRCFLNRDFSAAGSGTKFEKKVHHPEFKGQIIHVELENLSQVVKANPPPAVYDYQSIALAYVFASYRAEEWLTVTCHMEVDRGIANGHSDPRGFSFARFYSTIGALVGVSGTFGILDARMGNNTNQLSFKNTFPMQYGAVEHEKVLKKA
jgi:hypothetical protein